MNQATFLRRMSGNARLEQAMKLSDFVRNLVIADIKRKKLTAGGVMKELERRFRLVKY